jgi:membrane protein involved in colicin uptake
MTAAQYQNRQTKGARQNIGMLAYQEPSPAIRTGYQPPADRVRTRDKGKTKPQALPKEKVTQEERARRIAAQKKDYRERMKAARDSLALSPRKLAGERLKKEREAAELRKREREAKKLAAEAAKAEKMAERKANKKSQNMHGNRAEYAKVRAKRDEAARMARIGRIFANGPVTISKALEIDNTSHRSSMSGLMVYWRSLGLVDIISMEGKCKVWARTCP